MPSRTVWITLDWASYQAGHREPGLSLLTLHCSASVRRTSVEAEPSLRNRPRVSFSRHMSRMALAVFPVSFREWTNTSTYGKTTVYHSQETQLPLSLLRPWGTRSRKQRLHHYEVRNQGLKEERWQESLLIQKLARPYMNEITKQSGRVL